MKRSHYDVLQVSTRAVPSVIEAAYKNIKPALAESANNGVDDARNELVFLEEAYSVLSSPERRGLYDRSLTMSEPGVSYRAHSLDSSAQESESTFLGWWAHTRTSRFLLALAVFAAVFSVYKFVGQQGDHKVTIAFVLAPSVRLFKEPFRTRRWQLIVRMTSSPARLSAVARN